MNNCTFAGRLGKDAEMRYTAEGKAIAAFSVAVSGFKKGDTTWVSCSMFGERGEKLSQYLTKGSPVTVCGSVSVRAYEGKSGPGASLDLFVKEITLQGRPDRDEKQERDQSPEEPAFDDDVPF